LYSAEIKMQPVKSDTTTVGTRRAWEPPAVKRLAIGAETASPHVAGQGADAAQPSPPADPATKLGFSIEMAFPLSARLEQ
jgi:hypothetical protein